MEKIDRLGWVVQDNYRIGDQTVGVRCSSEPFADVLRSVLAPFETEEEAEPYLSVLFEGSSDGAIKKFNIVYRGSEHLMKTLSPRRFLQGVLREITEVTFGRRDDHLFVQAGTAVVDGVAVLLPHWTGNTREALSAQLGRAGFSLVDGSSVAIDPRTGAVVPVAAIADVPAGVYEELARIAPEPSRRERGIPGLAEPRPIGAAITWGVVDQDPLVPISRGLMVHALAQRSYNKAQFKASSLRVLASALEDIPCLSVKPGDGAADAVVDVIRRLAGGAGARG